MCLVRGGGLLVPGGSIPAYTKAGPPWTEFLTHATENITLPQTSGGNKDRDLCLDTCEKVKNKVM